MKWVGYRCLYHNSRHIILNQLTDYKSACESQPDTQYVYARETSTDEKPKEPHKKKMVNLSDIIASNKRIPSALPAGLVAVFVGGTSGIGEYTLKAFARYARAPKVIVVGRSQEAADRILSECRQLSPEGHFEFIRADVSLLKNVDDVCRQIKEKVAVINLLFESQGSMAFESETEEGLPVSFALATHSRLRFIMNLLPYLQRATSLRRVVSVGAATCEGAIDLTNVPGKGFPLMQLRDQVAAIGTLLLEEARRRTAPDVAFVHTVPGVVESGIMRDVKLTLRLSILIGISRLLAPFINVPPAEAGERHVFAATSAAFAPGQGAEHEGVSLEGLSLEVCRGTDGKAGSGVYSLSPKDDPASPKVEELLRQYREDGTARRVWDYVAADFMRITEREVAT
ncbi:putative short-chain dehydrogenases/reductase [Xylaria sp. FL1042]|nr:putative short-chain dehydrogenases/reductase [Xylaria sp. FL1042]